MKKCNSVYTPYTLQYAIYPNIFTAEKCTLQLTNGRIYLNFALNINIRNMLEQSLMSTRILCLRLVFNCQLWDSDVVLCYLFLVSEFR